MPQMICKTFRLVFHDDYFDLVVTDNNDDSYVFQSFSPDGISLIPDLLNRLAKSSGTSYVGWAFKGQNGIITG